MVHTCRLISRRLDQVQPAMRLLHAWRRSELAAPIQDAQYGGNVEVGEYVRTCRRRQDPAHWRGGRVCIVKFLWLKIVCSWVRKAWAIAYRYSWTLLLFAHGLEDGMPLDEHQGTYDVIRSGVLELMNTWSWSLVSRGHREENGLKLALLNVLFMNVHVTHFGSWHFIPGVLLAVFAFHVISWSHTPASDSERSAWNCGCTKLDGRRAQRWYHYERDQSSAEAACTSRGRSHSH